MKSLIKKLINQLPFNNFFDTLLATLNFAIAHRRFPIKKLFSEEFFRLKISDEIEDPLRQFTSDKELVKLFVKSIVGEKYNVPTLQILRNEIDIDSYEFPNRCCIKPTHASGKYIFKTSEHLNVEEIKSWLKLDYYKISRERNYKNLRKKIIVEPILFDSINVNDYKFFCKNGEVKFIQVDLDRSLNHKRNFYDKNWSLLDFSMSYPSSNITTSKPKKLNEMIEVARELSSFFTIVRIDFYTDNTNFYVGEITHCPESACGRIMPSKKESKVTQIFDS
tara:strand:- start:8607 stop:9440 length:834 start_codon:yes stop_codon:yes gene_type:complete